MHKKIIVGSILLFGLSPCIFSQEYLLGPDDVITIEVYREEELDREIRIPSEGSISFPLLGSIKAEDLTVSQLEKQITEGLAQYLKNPQVTVSIKEYATITVTGQVEEPGAYPMKGGLTIIEAIGLAGGFTKIAAQNRVKILRIDEKGKKKTIRVKVKKISSRGEKSKDIPLKRGDIVYVPESLF